MAAPKRLETPRRKENNTGQKIQKIRTPRRLAMLRYLTFQNLGGMVLDGFAFRDNMTAFQQVCFSKNRGPKIKKYKIVKNPDLRWHLLSEKVQCTRWHRNYDKSIHD